MTITNPEFVDSTDLNAWAPRREAQELLPRLIRHLLSSTPGVTCLSVRAGDGIGVPGWDVRADGGAGTAYVPPGASVWELSTSHDPRDQAQRNYRKRTKDPQGVTPASTTFVFVTLRRWGKRNRKDDKNAWVRERQAEGEWHKVVALDADDLEGWLEVTPYVHVWLSEQMGQRPLEVKTLDRWWKTWAAQTQPALPAELLLAGRQHESRELRRALQGTAAAIGLYGSSRDEAIAFLVASLIVPDEREAYTPENDPLAVALIVSSPQAWARLEESPSHAILVPDELDGADVASAVRGGHHVLVPMGSGDDERRACFVLPRLARDEARNALQAAGWPLERADRHAAQARRSLRSLRRELAMNPLVAQPGWAHRPIADPFAPLMLVGSWSADSAADCDTVAAIADREYARLERDLTEWAANDDPPFCRSGGSWRLAAPLDAWALLRPILTRDDLARWHDATLRVLAEPDPALDLPPADRPFAAIRGAQRTWSGDLRRGLAQGAALLGVTGEAPLADGRTGPDHAAALISELLTRANDDHTGNVWQSLADVLPLLAEAAPRQFLDGVDAGLAGDPPLLRLMFTDSQDTATLWGVSSAHTGLLWALEMLCWSPEYLSRAADTIARLAQIDPGGRLENRPRASLRRILLPRAPQTSAPLKRLLAVVARIVNRRPDIGWPLLLGLLPHMHDVIQNTYTPMFRDWKPDEEEVSLAQYLEAVHQLVGQVLVVVAQQPGRWVELVHQLPDLPIEELNRSLDALEGFAEDALDPGERSALWTAVIELVAQHRQFSSAKWALAEEPLKRLEAIAARIEPVDTAERHARLFDWHPNLPGTDKLERSSYDKALDDARRASVRDTLEHGGIGALIRLAEKCKLPRLVGMIAANVGGEDLAAQLLSGLAVEGPLREIAVGYVIRMTDVHGWDWVDHTTKRLVELPEPSRSVFYLSLPAEPRTWALVDADVEAIQDEYYRTVGTWGVTPDNAISLAERLLERGRPWSAIDLLAFQLHGTEAARPPVEIIERALRAALDPGVIETPQPGSLAYDIGVLFDNLEAMGVPTSTMFELEWAYFPLLQDSRSPRAILARLTAEPQLFVEAVCIVYGSRQEADGDTGSAIALQRRNCYSLLSSWRRPPGTADDGTIDRTVLRPWVNEARRLLAQHNCADIGDRCLGELLSGSPPGADGVWPAEPIRDIIEDLANENFERGLMAGKFFSRGVTWRGVYDGGKQEATLSNQFRSWAEQVEDRWLRTGRVLRNLADGYAWDAHQEDASAEKRADEG